VRIETNVHPKQTKEKKGKEKVRLEVSNNVEKDQKKGKKRRREITKTTRQKTKNERC